MPLRPSRLRWTAMIDDLCMRQRVPCRSRFTAAPERLTPCKECLSCRPPDFRAAMAPVVMRLQMVVHLVSERVL
jgi:hypothetical protein